MNDLSHVPRGAGFVQITKVIPKSWGPRWTLLKPTIFEEGMRLPNSWETLTGLIGCRYVYMFEFCKAVWDSQVLVSYV